MKAPANEKAPGLHPLAGARFRVFLRYALFTRGLDSRTRHQRMTAWVAQFIRFPFTCLETLKYRAPINRQKLDKPPIFIIGHWRSGTTHLYNMMSRDPQFGYLTFSETAMPLDMLGPKVKIFRWFIAKELPEDRGFDNVRLGLDDPQEEEMAMANLNPIGYLAIYYLPKKMAEIRDRALFFEGCRKGEIERFRRSYHYLIRKLNYVKKGKQLLFKNPASTMRMEMILKMYPNAKFIHIVRNPWEVYCSTRNHFQRAFNAFAWQSFSNIDVREYTLETYEKVMSHYFNERERLQLHEHQFVETSYEKITENPIGEMDRIYDSLGLNGKTVGLKHIRDFLGEIGGYQRNKHELKLWEIDQVRKRWKFSFDVWDYDLSPPSSIEIK